VSSHFLLSWLFCFGFSLSFSPISRRFDSACLPSPPPASPHALPFSLPVLSKACGNAGVAATCRQPSPPATLPRHQRQPARQRFLSARQALFDFRSASPRHAPPPRRHKRRPRLYAEVMLPPLRVNARMSA